jgi:23S rRNA (pseudouridine1915-N3)-methyltransferase
VKLSILSVGKPGALFAEPIAEYERRAARYWSLTTLEVREERASKATPPAAVQRAESNRLMEKVPDGAEAVALTRVGETWSSARLASYLDDLAVQGRAGAAFLIGGAFGLSDDVVARAHRRLSLSALTFTHELARLLLAEQLYRAGTILRGEPYHKART